MEKAVIVLAVLAIALTAKGEVLKFEHNVTVQAGHNAELVCKTRNIANYASTTITWVRFLDSKLIAYKNELPEDGDDEDEPGDFPRYTLDLNTPDEYTIRIRDAREVDSGKWVCSTDSNQEEVWLTVRVPPKITYISPTITAEKNKTHTLTCRADGNPTPAITWSRPGNSLPNGDILFRGQDLDLNELTSEDRGIYQCVASNTAGLDSAKVEVVMNYKPEVIVLKPEVQAYVNGRATLVCEYNANPAVSEVIWLRAGRPVSESTKLDVKIFTNTAMSQLVFGRVRSDQWGQYECKVRNLEGIVSKLINFSEGRPEATPSSQRVRSGATTPTASMVAVVTAISAAIFRL